MSERKAEDEIVSAATVVADGPLTELVERTRTVLAGRYEVQALLGSGGMGAVYRARDRELDEPVALKMLSRTLVDHPAMLSRFKQEVKLARRVTHRNVARMFDLGEHEGDKFLTMELVDGESLAALLARERPMKMLRVVKILEDVCAGLGAAHAAGVIHRDLKPENVLVGKDGRVVITDFGIARLSGGDTLKTMGVPIGTPAYMAPEQVEGASDIDARADIYALGTMLFELLTGERAWLGESVYQVASLRLVYPPPNPRERRAEIPEPIAQIVMKCMARRREDRFTTAEEVAAALSAITLPATSITPTSHTVVVRSRPPPALATTSAAMKTVAVLPLRNSGPPEDEYLADGLTDDLIDTLSMGKGLRVRSRGAVRRFKSSERDPRDVGRELDVQVTVDGSVRRVGDQLRISVHLVSTSDGFQLWAKRFERPITELLKVGDEAANAICEALTLEWQAPARVGELDPLAMDLLLRARHEYHQMWRDSNNRAVSFLEQALTRAPTSPEVLNALALALCRRFAFDDTADDAIDRALHVAGRSLELAPGRGEPHVALASVKINTGDAVGGARELRKALELSPQSADANELCGRLLSEAGRPDEGIARGQLAMSIEPGLEGIRYEIARVRALEGNWEEADAIFATLPEGLLANIYWISRWRVVLWKGDRELASRLLAHVADLTFGIQHAVVGMLAVCVHGKVSPESIIELDARARPGRARRRRAFFRQLKAEVLAYCNDTAGALTALVESEDAGLFDIFWLDHCPVFDRMRSEPRFLEVREKVQARATAVLEALTAPTR
jgi:eukaryotic-like serine/threonine-protein kinase